MRSPVTDATDPLDTLSLVNLFVNLFSLLSVNLIETESIEKKKKEAKEKENPVCTADQDLLALEKLAPSQSLEVNHPLESQIAHHVLSGYEEAARKAKNATFIMSVHVLFG